MAKTMKKIGAKPASQEAVESPNAPEAGNLPPAAPEAQEAPLANVPTATPTALTDQQMSIPKGFRELARVFGARYHVPEAFILAVAALETDFGRKVTETHNAFNIRAVGTENAGHSGLAWFHSYVECFDRFCLILTRRVPFVGTAGHPEGFASAWARNIEYAIELKRIMKQMEGMK